MMKKLLQIMVTVIFSLCLVCTTVATVSAASVGKVKKAVATAAPTSVTLKWTAPSGAKGYQVQQYTKKKWKTVKTISNAKTTSVKIADLKPKTTYKFRIAAKGKKSYGSYVTVSVKTPSVPAAKNLKVTPALDTASLQWSKASGVTGYKVEYSTSKSFSKKTTKTATVKGSGTVKTTLKKLSPGKTYYIRVRAYATANKTDYYGSYSKVVTIKTAYKAKAGSVKVKSTTYDSAVITWKKVSDASGYQIERKDGKKWVSVKSDISKANTSYTVKKLSAVTKYSLRIRPFRKINGKIYGGEWVTVTATTGVGPTKKLAYKSLTSTSVKLTWSAAAGAKGYYVKNNGKTVSTVSTNSATLTLKPGTAYKITVVAYNGKKEGTVSSAVSFTSPCAKVSGLKVSSKGETSLGFTWSKAAGAKSYEVQYRKSGGSWSSVASTTSTSYTVKNLAPNTTYQFHVRALNKNGSSTQRGSYSSEVSAATYGVTATPSDASKIKLSWGAVSSAKSYTLQRYDAETASWKTVKTVTGTSYTVTAGNISSYRVIAKNSSGSTLYTSNAFVFKGSGVTVTQFGNEVSIAWSKVSKATSYQVRRSTSVDWTDIDEYSKSTYKAKYFLAPGLVHNIKVYAILSSSEKVLCEVNLFAPAMNISDTSAQSKNAQLHYLAEAINRSKYDNSQNTTIEITGVTRKEIAEVSIGGSGAGLVVAFLQAKAGIFTDLGYYRDPKTDDYTWNTPERIDKFVNVMNSMVDDGSQAMRYSESELERSYFKKKGSILGTMTEDGVKSAVEMYRIFEPMGRGEYVAEVYNGTDSAAAAKAITVTTTKTSKGHKIVATIKKEKTPNYHRGFMSDIVSGVISLTESEGAPGAAITIGDTKIVAEIDKNCQLISYSISSPYTATAGLAAENIETEEDGTVDLSFVTKLKGKTDYTYKFTRS